MADVTPDDPHGYGKRTASVMHDTADELEDIEAGLHHSAEQSPEPGTAARLHALGDRVTAQAKDIDRRADLLDPPEPSQ
jgi:hypothetical protein